MSRLSDARQELAYALDDDPIERREEIAGLRGEIAYLLPFYVRRYRAAMAFIAAEKAHHRIGGVDTWRALEAARVARREASDACDKAGAL